MYLFVYYLRPAWHRSSCLALFVALGFLGSVSVQWRNRQFATVVPVKDLNEGGSLVCGLLDFGLFVPVVC